MPEPRLGIVTSVDAGQLRDQFGGDSPAPPLTKRVPIKVEGYLVDRGPHRDIVFEHNTPLSPEWTKATDACAGKVTLQSSTLGRSHHEMHTS